MHAGLIWFFAVVGALTTAFGAACLALWAAYHALAIGGLFAFYVLEARAQGYSRLATLRYVPLFAWSACTRDRTWLADVTGTTWRWYSPVGFKCLERIPRDGKRAIKKGQPQ